VRVRICLRDPDTPADAQRAAQPESGNAAASVRAALAIYAPLREKGQVRIRLHRGVVYGSIYYADDELLVSQRAYGIPAGSAPVLHLRRAEGGDIVSAYLDAFEVAWEDARPME